MGGEQLDEEDDNDEDGEEGWTTFRSNNDGGGGVCEACGSSVVGFGKVGVWVVSGIVDGMCMVSDGGGD